MDETDDFEITVFEEPVTIKCNVEGKNLMAEITSEYHDPTTPNTFLFSSLCATFELYICCKLQ